MSDSDPTISYNKAPFFQFAKPLLRQNDDDSLEIECSVEAQPIPEIKWFYNNVELTPGERTSFRVTPRGDDLYSAVLKLKEIGPADQGTYRCDIRNSLGRAATSVTLNLSEFAAPIFTQKPEISYRRKSVNNTLIMKFNAKSRSDAKYEWFKDGELIPYGRHRRNIILNLFSEGEFEAALEIPNPNEQEDEGTFECKVKNGIGTGTLTATFHINFGVPRVPTIVREPEIVENCSSSATAVKFIVAYQAWEEAQVTWRDPKRKTISKTKRMSFGQHFDSVTNVRTAFLELKNCKPKDRGTYICKIRNAAGEEANASLTLNIDVEDDDTQTNTPKDVRMEMETDS